MMSQRTSMLGRAQQVSKSCMGPLPHCSVYPPPSRQSVAAAMMSSTNSPNVCIGFISHSTLHEYSRTCTSLLMLFNISPLYPTSFRASYIMRCGKSMFSLTATKPTHPSVQEQSTDMQAFEADDCWWQAFATHMLGSRYSFGEILMVEASLPKQHSSQVFTLCKPTETQAC